MSKLSKEKRDKLILICLMFAGVVGVLYTFVLGSQRDKLDTYNTQLMSVRDKISKAERLLRNGPMIEQNLAENRKTLQAMQQDMTPPGQHYYWFLKLVEDFRTKQGLDQNFLADLRHPEPNDAGVLPRFPYKALSFGVRTSGRFQEIGKFIADFENAYPYMRVEDIRLQPETGARSSIRARTAPGENAAPEPEEGAVTEKIMGDINIVAYIKPSAT